MKKSKFIFLVIVFFSYLHDSNVFAQDSYFTNFPWTKLINVDEELLSEYENVFLANKKELIFDSKLYEQFEGQGGFSFSLNDSKELELHININTIKAMSLKVGNIVSLNSIGSFEDVVLGSIKGEKFEYTFSISGNHLYVLGYGELDNIRESFNNLKTQTKSINYPWTNLADVSQDIIDKYSLVFKEYMNQLLFDDENFEKYGGKGGFTVSKNAFDSLDVNININTLLPVRLKNGVINSLNEIGKFKDTYLGNISGEDYNYTFSIVDNNLVLTGAGEVNNLEVSLSQNKTFDNNNTLSYFVNYPWTKFVSVNNETLLQYDNVFAEYGQQLIFDPIIFQNYGGQGGVSLSKNAYGQLVIDIKLDLLEPNVLRSGQILSLGNLGVFSDVELVDIVGDGYSYQLSIKDNFLFIEGSGSVNKLNLVVNEKLKYLQDLNYPWTRLVNVDSQLKANYEDVFEKNKLQLLFDDESFEKYGANGGLTFTRDSDNNIVLTANINTSFPISLVEGNVLSLDSFGSFDDVELGRISDEDYEYKFSIRNNFFYVEGEGNLGDIKDLNFSFVLNMI